MCSNQIVRRNDHTSFSVLGLSIILGVGFVVGFVCLILQKVMKVLRKNKKLEQTWTELGLLQLQRRVLEMDNPNTWQGDGDVPTASTEHMFEMPLRPSRSPNDEENQLLVTGGTGPLSPQEVIARTNAAPPGSDLDLIFGPNRTPIQDQERIRIFERDFGRR